MGLLGVMSVKFGSEPALLPPLLRLMANSEKTLGKKKAFGQIICNFVIQSVILLFDM